MEKLKLDTWLKSKNLSQLSFLLKVLDEVTAHAPRVVAACAAQVLPSCIEQIASSSSSSSAEKSNPAIRLKSDLSNKVRWPKNLVKGCVHHLINKCSNYLMINLKSVFVKIYIINHVLLKVVMGAWRLSVFQRLENVLREEFKEFRLSSQ